MSVDALQEKIRKKKNALMVDMTVLPLELPPHLLTDSAPAEACGAFCRELMETMKGSVPALRFSFGAFALMDGGISVLKGLLEEAVGMGYYVLLDAPELLSIRMAEHTAKTLLGGEDGFVCDGVVISVYSGTDMLRPFMAYCAEAQKDVFCVVRTAKKSASEMQDLLTGSRLVHLAAADRISRYSGEYTGKYGYSRVGFLAAASSAESLRSLRSKYTASFIMADGLDYPSANMKNAAMAFDRLGRGGVVCAGPMVTGAWKTEGSDGTDFAAQAAAAVDRIRKNLQRYITIL